MNVMPNDFRDIPLPVASLSDEPNDEVFIAFASPERRCLGIAQRFGDYRPKHICLMRIEDEPNDARQANIVEFCRLLNGVAAIADIPVRHSDVLYGLDRLLRIVQESRSAEQSSITFDISTVPKGALLVILRALSRLENVGRIRLLYTEPATYEKWLEHPVSYGVRRVAVVPTFTAPYRAHQDLVLIALLGYERDRALGMWQSIEPNRTVAVIGRPSYHPEWDGKVERHNAALLAGLEDSAVFYVDPRNPIETYELLKSIIAPETAATANYYIAPLGTKPQIVGVHFFCEEFPDAATVAYASPLEPNSEYISDGIGRSWQLPSPMVRR